jgi:hypothetical protein
VIDSYQWTGIVFALLELGVLAAAFLLVQRHAVTHPQAVRLCARAIIIWAVVQVLGTVLQFVPMDTPLAGYPTLHVDWMATMLSPATLWMVARWWVLSGLYAWALWLIGYAALAQPDRRVPS